MLSCCISRVAISLLFKVVIFCFYKVKEFGKGPAPGGKGKGAASAKPPQFYEVCEQVKPLVDQGESIPPSLMAKLLKFKLLHVKQKDLDRREDERKVLLNIYLLNYIFYFLTNFKIFK